MGASPICADDVVASESMTYEEHFCADCALAKQCDKTCGYRIDDPGGGGVDDPSGILATRTAGPRRLDVPCREPGCGWPRTGKSHLVCAPPRTRDNHVVQAIVVLSDDIRGRGRLALR